MIYIVRKGDNNMKEASGELSMTVVTIIAVALILAFLYFFWGTIKNKIVDTFNNATDATNVGNTVESARH
jgi:phosphotransferase system  glucose/maltose/N-acetylglucosamine-specific IIC component